MDIGTCCYCGFECNPNSQACGSCMRSCTAPYYVYDYKEPKLKNIPTHFVRTILLMKEEDRTCAICTNIVDDDIYMTPCYHIFHLACMKESCKNKYECPICRTEIKDD